MNFTQTREYLDNLSLKGSVLGLDNMLALDEALNHPVKNIKAIHIAGTNGKGSVTEYVKNILIASGYKVGCYTSPVVFDYLEKIRYGNRNISKTDFAECISLVRKVSEEIGLGITVFEAETMAAYLYFAKKNCDVIVVEAGLGGETDATNILQNTIASVFSSISCDHTDILGKTVEEIAKKKAGIIKPGSIVISAKASESIINIFKSKADKVIETTGNEAKSYKLKMTGNYQQMNASVAVNVANALMEKGYSITEKSIKKALEETSLPGRFEIVSKKPLTIIDGAHNEAAAKELRNTLIEKYPNKPKVFIMGIFADKDYESIIANTVDLAEHIVTLATPDSKRALPSMDLANSVRDLNPNVSMADSVEEAYELAKILCKGNGMIVAFGSLSYLGRLKDTINKMNGGK